MIAPPLVSVIVPTYNHADYLHEALQSVLSQTYSNWEAIVINNYSEDNTIEIVQSFSEPRIHLLNFHNNGIIAAARNHGVLHAKGEYLAFLDSDDIWLPNKIERQLEIMRQNNNSLCHTDIKNIDATGSLTKNKNLIKKIKKKFLYGGYKQLLVSNTITTSSVIIRRDFLSSIRFDEEPHLIAVEDYYLWLFLYNVDERSCYFLDEELVKYRQHDSSISAGYNRQQLRSMYCLVKHLLFVKNYQFYPLMLFVCFIFSVKHLLKSVLGFRKIFCR